MSSRLTTGELSALEYDLRDEAAVVRFFAGSPGGQQCVAELEVNFVEISFYAKRHLRKKPPLLECGISITAGAVERFLIPTGRNRTAGNGSIAVKYIDVSKPIKDEEVEKYERVGIRLPTGAFTYAFFESQYLKLAEDPRRGALFLIDPSMIVVQHAMSDEQKREFQTFGGKKVLYFDVLDAPNLQERHQEIKRCKERGDEQRKRYEEADKQWEEEMAERLRLKAEEEASKPKLSKKAKQKAKQAEKKGQSKAAPPEISAEACSRDDLDRQEEAEQERLHKQRQAESRARAEEDLRTEKEAEAHRKKLEAAEAKRLAEQEAAEEASRMSRLKGLLQKIQSSLGNARAEGYPSDN
eukprot:TRINITY_DN41763_c0_g1_i1.p1 TRINITY_DN41763_c0_g1~~TRINITY_DN41763_c0_g1_i1.p1  ORF type:complete len:354 (-),score=122.98 TRINITY_DN41763_c0_g1_i1:130-1191(-)